MISRGPQIQKFFARYLRLPDGKGAGQPFVMEPWQAYFTSYFHQLAPPTQNQVTAYTSGKSSYAYRGEPMRRVFRFGLLGIPRGNGKSPLASGYGLYEIGARLDGPKFYCLAASKQQADVVHTFSRLFVEGGPLKKHGYWPGANAIKVERNAAKFQALTTAGLNVHGLNAAGFIGDELHAFVTPQQVETWAGLYTTLHKRDNPFALGITTAGFKKETLLGETYDRLVDMPVANIKHSNPCLRIHEDRDSQTLFWWYGIPEELAHRWEDPTLWRYANPASWIDVDDLKFQLTSGGIDELTFQRLHLNMWTGAKNAWLRTGVWAGLVGSKGPFKKGEKIWVGVDIGWSDDSSAVVWCMRKPNGTLALRAKIWTTRTDQVGEYVRGGVMDLELVENFVLDLHKRYKLVELAYDPIYFGRSMQLLRKAGMKERQFIEMPPMHAHTRAAWQALKQHAEAGEIEHDGDPDFAAHANAVGEEPGVNGPRVTKQASGKIDAMAAAALAVSRADLALDKPAPAKVFWMDVESDSDGYERLPDPDEE